MIESCVYVRRNDGEMEDYMERMMYVENDRDHNVDKMMQWKVQQTA